MLLYAGSLLALPGKAVLVEELQEWLLVRSFSTCPHIWSQCQSAPRQPHCWPKPSPAGMVVQSWGQRNQKVGKKTAAEERSESTRDTALQTPRSVQRTGGGVSGPGAEIPQQGNRAD